MSTLANMMKLAASAAIALALTSAALAENVKATFVLVNDIYEMDEVNGRGGFPRVAAAVKAERAEARGAAKAERREAHGAAKADRKSGEHGK